MFDSGTRTKTTTQRWCFPDRSSGSLCVSLVVSNCFARYRHLQTTGLRPWVLLRIHATTWNNICFRSKSHAEEILLRFHPAEARQCCCRGNLQNEQVKICSRFQALHIFISTVRSPSPQGQDRCFSWQRWTELTAELLPSKWNLINLLGGLFFFFNC